MTSKEFRNLNPDQQNIVRRFTSEYPVKLGQLATSLGVSAIKLASMPSNASGNISREEAQYIIRINRNEARERQRFTIAHEIAHFLLHKNIIDRSPDGITDNVLYRSGAPETIEYEANRLAADLVMPLDLIEEKLRRDFKGIVTEATIESLAASFGVSKAAMEIRLSTLVGA